MDSNIICKIVIKLSKLINIGRPRYSKFVAARHQQELFEVRFDKSLIFKKLLNLKVLLSFIWCLVQILMLEFINLVIFSLLALTIQ